MSQRIFVQVEGLTDRTRAIRAFRRVCSGTVSPEGEEAERYSGRYKPPGRTWAIDVMLVPDGKEQFAYDEDFKSDMDRYFHKAVRQAYGVESALQVATQNGLAIEESVMADGSIQVLVSVA